MLYIVATPMGNPDDISVRALKCLQSAELIIGEERKEVGRLISILKLGPKTVRLLNEHTDKDEVLELAHLCQKQTVALVSDCGTPNFCDPGFQLVKVCRKKKIPMTSLPGASSLMTLLSFSSERLYEFHFRGFLPSETQARQKALQKMGVSKIPTIIMDTPYRFRKTIDDLQTHLGDRLVLLAMDLTSPNERVIECLGKDLRTEIRRQAEDREKSEFLVLIYDGATDQRKWMSHGKGVAAPHRTKSLS